MQSIYWFSPCSLWKQSILVQSKGLLLLLVMSPFLAIIACLILVTSAPPTYDVLFISQFVMTLSHGLGPFLCVSTFSWYSYSFSILVFLVWSISRFLCSFHLSRASLPLILRCLYISSSECILSNNWCFRSSFWTMTFSTRSFSSSSRYSSSAILPGDSLVKPHAAVPAAGLKPFIPESSLIPVSFWETKGMEPNTLASNWVGGAVWN